MKRDLNLEGFSVLGSIKDCVALRKLVYRPFSLVYLFVSAKTKYRQQTFKMKMARRRQGKMPLDKTRDKLAW